MRRLPGLARCLASGPDTNARRWGRRSSFRTGMRTWSSKCAPRWVQRICCFFDHPLADHLVHCRFHERRRDRLAVAIAIPVVGDEGLVGLDIVMEFAHGFEHRAMPTSSYPERTRANVRDSDETLMTIAPPASGRGPGTVTDAPPRHLQRLKWESSRLFGLRDAPGRAPRVAPPDRVSRPVMPPGDRISPDPGAFSRRGAGPEWR
jgi:hypothetical protein